MIYQYNDYVILSQGCIDILEIYIREHLIIIGAVAAGVCSLQVRC